MIEKHNFKRLVIAAYRLPFKFVKSKDGYRAIQNSGGLVSAILSLSENFKKKTSKGIDNKILWTGVADDLPKNFSSNQFKNEYFDIAPVDISHELNNLYYGGFCNDLIWPLFHYFPSYSMFNNEYFAAYEEANTRFCDKIVKIIKPGDFIWVHDYQLLLLPQMIREKIPEANIGFFLHIPFPSFEIFRLLPRKWRESIISGMLGADLIGFHTHDYAKYFIKTVKRTLGFECRQNIIYTNKSLVKADAFPIGIDYNKFHSACTSEKVLVEKQKIREHLSDQKLIFSVDRLDYTKGLLLRLKGFETFLESYPQWHQKVVFNMVIVPSRDNIEKYKDMKKELEYTVGRINGKYSSLAWRPIIYQYKSLSFDELVALYDLSDVGLITPLRDGMNLVAKEYIACQVENNGVLILSEMAGAAAELNEALLINPVDNVEVAISIFNALEMEDSEKQFRNKRMQNRIASYNVFSWAYDFFNQAFETKEQQKSMNVKIINKNISSKIVSEYKNAGCRIIFLDYDGTLVAFSKYPELATISDNALKLINLLSKDPKNEVVIISGRNKEFLDLQFKNIEVSLVAEHGYFIKKKGENWKVTVDSNQNWKETVKPILLEYVNRCNGTFIEEKVGSIAWHYRNADSDFALLRLNELRYNLAEVIRHKTEFEILEGNKVLEIKSGKYDKGETATSMLEKMNYDFILAAGDDKTDELMFKALPESAYSIKIGLSPSFAKYNLADYTGLLDLLKILTRLD